MTALGRKFDLRMALHMCVILQDRLLALNGIEKFHQLPEKIISASSAVTRLSII